MSNRFYSTTLLLLVGVTAQAQTAPAGAGDPSTNAVQMDRFVVSETLDQAREAIVPNLGATQYAIARPQIDASALGANQGFNQVLLRVPGVAQDSYGQVHLRGEHANLQIRINDVMLPEGISGFGQDLDTAFVRRVSVVTGALPAQYGFRTAGVVDIHTLSGTSLGRTGDLTLMGGAFGSLNASVSAAGSSARTSDFVTASAESNDLGIENPTASRSALHDHTRQLKMFNDLSWLLGPTRRLTFMAGGAFATFQIPNTPGLAPAYAVAGHAVPASAALDENQAEDNAYAILTYQTSTDAFSAQVSAFTRYSLTDFRPDLAGDLAYNGVASRVHRDVVVNGVEADARRPLSDTHTLRAGFIVTASNASTATDTAVFPVDAQGAQASSTPLFVADGAHKLGVLAGAYAQDEWKPLEGLTLNAGVRADLSHAYVDESQLSPRLNAVYRIDNVTTLHVGYARYFTPPPLELVQTTDIARFAGTTNAPAVNASSPVLAERADYFDAGVSRQLSPGLTATVDAYDKFASRQLDEGQFGAALIFSPFNYRKGHIQGVECSLDYQGGAVSAYANAALSRATGRDIISGEFQFSPDELAYIAAHDVHLDHDQTLTASTGLSCKLDPRTLLYAEILYGSGLRRGFANTSHLPAYHPLNLGASRSFAAGGGRLVRVRLDLVNVFDEVYELRDGSGIGVGAPQYGQRRGLYGTVTLVF